MVCDERFSDFLGPKFKSEDYIFDKEYAPSHDGEEIPLTIVRKKDMKKNGMYDKLF